VKAGFAILKHQLPAILWAIFIYILCTSSGSGFKSQTFLGIETDKLGHAFIFCVFVYFMMLGLISLWRFSFLLKRIRLIAFIISVAYAGIIEMIQHYYTSDRTGDYWDFVADIIGSMLGWLMFHSVYGNLKFLDKE